jgi:hypothetical protein
LESKRCARSDKADSERFAGYPIHRPGEFSPDFAACLAENRQQLAGVCPMPGGRKKSRKAAELS